jgi:hypothetical protein
MADLVEMKPLQSTMLKRVYYHGSKLVPLAPKKSRRESEMIESKFEITKPFEMGYRLPSQLQLQEAKDFVPKKAILKSVMLNRTHLRPVEICPLIDRFDHKANQHTEQLSEKLL